MCLGCEKRWFRFVVFIRLGEHLVDGVDITYKIVVI